MDAHNVDVSEQKALKRQAADNGPTTASDPAAHPLLLLQSQVGNAQVARMVAQRASEEDDLLHAAHDEHDETVGLEGGPVGPETQSRIQAMRGGGASLDDGTRAAMESSFDTSFEGVRVHHDADSDALNRQLTARAFTTGNDIFLRSDSSPADSHLIAHELTHVVQQRSMDAGGSDMTVGAAVDAHEHHAESVASAVTSAAPAPVAPAGAQRTEDDEPLQANHDLAQRAAVPDEDDIQASHDHAQREVDEDDIQATHETLQRHGADDAHH